ncbi:MAG: 23S rRNA (adenine(2503)-C(2))-methyltransferase RlmN [Crocinitomicaceae bacterium]
MEAKKNIRELSLEELLEEVTSLGEKAFRGKQIYEWLWKKGAQNFDDMTNISLSTREKLKESYYIDAVSIAELQRSSDRTIKTAFRTQSGIVEGVLIPTTNRVTACISSQIGCSLACTFCATGKLKLKRNLTAGEIFDQVYHIKKLAENEYDQQLTNIVYMGMGEPLLNYKNMLRSVEMITSEKGLGMSPRRITISTAGIAKMIKKLADDEVKFNLALSLHAANDAKRSQMMEINETNNLDALMEALQYFYQKTGTRPTYEYIIFKDFNDSIEDAKELIAYCQRNPAKVNIIEYNSIDDEVFQKADPEQTDRFANYLEKHGVIVNVRRSRGKDIDAACGQLANKNKEAQPEFKK